MNNSNRSQTLFAVAVAAVATTFLTVTAESNAATLTAAYAFEGSANDGVGSNDLTLNTGSSLAVIDGRNALAITTDPGNASVATPDSALSIPTTGGDTGKFSIATWIRYDSSNEQFARAIARSYSGGDGYNLAFESGNAATSVLNFRVNFDGSGDVTYRTTGSISRDTWHHVAFSYDNGTATGWIDGVSTAFTSGGGGVQGGEPFVLGTGTSSTSGFVGALDDVSFFHGVLTQSEVTALVPEPSALVLAVFAALGLIGFPRRKR